MELGKKERGENLASDWIESLSGQRQELRTEECCEVLGSSYHGSSLRDDFQRNFRVVLEPVRELVRVEPIEEYYSYINQFDDGTILNIATEGPYYPNLRTIVINLVRIMGTVHYTLTTRISQEEMDRFNRVLPRLDSAHQDYPDFRHQISDWRGLIGSCFELLNSLDSDTNQGIRFIATEFASNLSLTFAVITETMFQLVPHIGCVSLICSFGEMFRSKTIINRVIKTMKEDREKFEFLNKWFTDTKVLDDYVTRLFPHRIDLNILMGIEETLTNLSNDQKIFATVLLSNIKNNTRLFKDARFLSKNFHFCRCSAAKRMVQKFILESSLDENMASFLLGDYILPFILTRPNMYFAQQIQSRISIRFRTKSEMQKENPSSLIARMIVCEYPTDQEHAMETFGNELMELQTFSFNLGPIMEIGIFNLKALKLPRSILSGLHSVVFLYCYRGLENGFKHPYSDNLRKIARNSQSFLNTMENIRLRDL
ncbi:hypothetical protein CEXT_59811 [Caerostris extrusa]|uniref:Uncharacterized protein n=1 Tax=Caerostris extrusa TaxID=172846 RepID=A0AAV4XWS4_CAEEX|nr:hypothetical protein CEXT_59811 [Caerostris extrusa]